jgi:hypothetical protein
MSKTPFEIRLDLLNLSQSILNDKIWNERQRIDNDWTVNKEQCAKKNKPAPAYPNVPTVNEDDIIALAKKLNEFVSNGQ